MIPIKKERLSSRVIDTIKELIRENDFKPGDKIFSENELTKKLEVSRTSIREAIRILEVTGYVNVKHGKGIYLSDYHENNLEKLKKWFKGNEDTLCEQFEVRLLLEPHSASQAASNAKSKIIDEMEKLYEEYVQRQAIDDLQGAIKTDTELHLLIAKSAKNRTLYYLMKTMTSYLNEPWITSLITPGRMTKTVKEHRKIIDAIKNKDSRAARRAMEQHLKNALKEIKQYFNSKLP